MTHFVYVLKSESGPVKVGMTCNVPNRFSALRQKFRALKLSVGFVGECSEDIAGKIETATKEILRSYQSSAKSPYTEWFLVPAETAVKAVLFAASELGYELKRRKLDEISVCWSGLRARTIWVDTETLGLIDEFRKRHALSRSAAIRIAVRRLTRQDTEPAGAPS